MKKQILIKENIISNFEAIVSKEKWSRIMLVCGRHVGNTDYGKYFLSHESIKTVFQDYEVNPTYDNVLAGVSQFKKNNCDAVLAVGGGSAIDVSKCIKAFSTMNEDIDYLQQSIKENEVPLVVLPTTAGTGSESTKFSVIYLDGEKISVEDESLLPDIVFLDSSVLVSLPIYQKKVTLLDALCHGIESYWAKGANDESRSYAAIGIKDIVKYYKPYLDGDMEAAEYIMYASNNTGRAINISKTTAAHAMSYKLTKLYDLPHGHAVALSLLEVWRYTNKLADEKLKELMLQLAEVLGCKNIEESIDAFKNILSELEIKFEKQVNKEDLKVLVNAVNIDRLSNHPVLLSKTVIEEMYSQLLRN